MLLIAIRTNLKKVYFLRFVDFVWLKKKNKTDLFGGDSGSDDVIGNAVGHVLKRGVFCGIGSAVVFDQLVLYFEEVVEFGQ